MRSDRTERTEVRKGGSSSTSRKRDDVEIDLIKMTLETDKGTAGGGHIELQMGILVASC